MFEPIQFSDTATAFSRFGTRQLKRMRLLFKAMGRPELTKIGIFLIKAGFWLKIPIKGLIRKTLFNQFCGGESLEESDNSIKELGKYRILSIPDYCVEGLSDEQSFEATLAEILGTIHKAAEEPAIGFAVFKMTALASAALLEKHQKGEILNTEEKVAYARVEARIDQIGRLALEKGVSVLADAEESWIQGSIDELMRKAMGQFNRHRSVLYNTLQAYRADAYSRLQADYALASQQGWQLAIKLVRGAYMEKENQQAQSLGKTSPIHVSKANTDACFNTCLQYCLDKRISLCAGSHNEESNQLLVRLMQEKGLDTQTPDICFAQLYGMSDHISFNLAARGYRVAKYLPYGPVEKVMPYLFRRAAENKSVTGQTSRELRLIEAELKRRKTAN